MKDVKKTDRVKLCRLTGAGLTKPVRTDTMMHTSVFPKHARDSAVFSGGEKTKGRAETVKRRDVERWACLAVCLLCFAMTAYYLIAGYGAYLDSDMASELALAQHLSREGTLISGTWRYSTEVRVLSTQIVYTPLMAVFPGNWRLVRTLGNLILLAVMAAACYGCARALGSNRRYACLISGLSVSALSVVYSQMIPIGTYYVPHAVLTFACVGLTARWMQRPGQRALGCMTLVLGAVMGASSVRYLLCAALPVAAAGAWDFVFAKEQLPRRREQMRRAVPALAVCAAAVAGYVLGQKLLDAWCISGSARYGGSRLQALNHVFAALEEALCGLVKLLGYTEGALLFSVHGLASVGAFLMLGVSAVLLVRGLRANRARFGALVLVMSAGLTLFTFVMVEGLYLNRYWIPVMTLGAPVMAACLTAEGNSMLRRLGALALCGVVVLSSAVQIRDSMREPEITPARYEAAQQVLDSGLTFGYATFWNANVLTELTNGRVEVVAMRVSEQGVPVLDSWLEIEENTGENRPEQEVFLLLSPQEREQLQTFLDRCGAQEETLADGSILARVSSQHVFFEAMASDGNAV